MSPVKARTALQHAAIGVVLVGIVVLVTVCFNIIGALSCSILTGMLLGATRQWKWQTIPVSLVFPAATFCLLEFAKGDIPERTRIKLSVLCWAGFAVTFLLTYVLVYFERPAQSPSKPVPSQPVESAATPAAVDVAVGPPAPTPPSRLTLKTLQGQWSGEALGHNGQAQKRMLEVAGDELVLWVTDGKGQVTCQAKGRVKLE